ncbi:MAG: lipopolysaccharide biosynthesis protein [Phycisphaerae bacterium]|nr:MAG: lipopolysaccharide biosynthesis protein [Phycisphaerae bacterium]
MGKSKSSPSDFLETSHLEGDLRKRSLQGGGFTAGAQISKFLLGLGFTYVLARALTPEDFGIMGMVLVVTGFVARFKDLGLSMATVQRAAVDHDQVSTLFWLNVAIGAVLTLATAAMAPVVVWYYDEPRLMWITVVLSLAMLIGGLTAQHHALLRRQMQFRALAIIQIAAAITAPTVAIILALLGAKYWALVAMHLVAAATIAIGSWVACGWRPGAPRRSSGVNSMINFGGNLAAASLFNHVSRNLDNFLIGGKLGATSLGMYTKAYQLLLLPIRQINAPVSGVAIPTLSRLQNDPRKYRGFYRRGVQLVTFIGLPIVAFTFVAAERVVMTMLGPQWTEAVLVFQVLAPAAMVTACNIATGWVYVSLAHTRRQLYWTIVESIATTLAFVIGLQWGIVGVAAGCSIAFCVLWLPGIIYCFKPTPVKLSDFFGSVWRGFCASLIAAGTLYAVSSSFVPGGASIPWLFVDAALYAVAYFGSWLLIPNGWATLNELFSLLRSARSGPGSIDVVKDEGA